MLNLYPYTTTIDAAKEKLYHLALKIFVARDLSKVEAEIAQASQIRFGLMALEQYPDFLDEDSRLKIITGLNSYANVYNQQTIPNITI